MHEDTNGSQRPSDLLTGWKAIAQHFGRTQSTVRRWAATAGLPVYRAAGGKGLSVYAYATELDAWLTRHRRDSSPPNTDLSSTPTVEEPEEIKATGALSRPRWVRWAVPFAVLLLFAGVGATTWIQKEREAPVTARTSEAVPKEARELYLRGTYLWNRRTPAGILGAIETLTQAIDIYPNYAEAYAGLAITYNLARQYSDMTGWEAYPKAESAARRAIELDPDLDLAQSALAFIEFHWHWRVEAGLARFQEALRLNPDSANTLMWYASSLLLADRPREALEIINRAQSLDPHNSTIVNIKAQALFYTGQGQEALDLLDTMIAEDPHHAWAYYSRYIIQLSQGNYSDYLDSYARLGDLIDVPRYRAAAEAGAAALAEGGAPAMAMAMFAVEREFYERGEALAWDLARHHAILGDADKALRWLRISLKRREERLIGIKADSAFWPIRGHPDYTLLLQEIGFPSEGSESG